MSEYYKKAEEHFNKMGGNNGLGHTNNPARHWSGHFCYRSPQEIMFSYALAKRRRRTGEQFGYMPLGVWSFPNQKRRELDFFIVDRGIYQAVEIDGESHREETVLARNEKEKFCNVNKIDTLRFVSHNTDDADWADECVEELFDHMKYRRKGPEA